MITAPLSGLVIRNVFAALLTEEQNYKSNARRRRCFPRRLEEASTPGR